MNNQRYVWRRELNRYQWFVLVVAALGWLFDTMDQQLFNLARMPAMRELLAPSPGAVPNALDVATYGGYATSIFLIGWASGGLFFGVLGDRVGRAKTMILTILVYSMCTGLSALSQGFWDFAIYRFLTGLGVGGEFAVGVALVAEVMPNRARPYALGLLQALSTVGNVVAALVSIGLGHVEETGALASWQLFGVTFTAWRTMFVVGTLPALLVVVILRRLKEPEQWQEAVRQAGGRAKLGSYAELFGDPRWRRRSIVGLLLATSGVIGLWGIAFFGFDLNSSVLRKTFEQDARDANQAAWDRDFLRLVARDLSALDSWAAGVKPVDLVNSSAKHADAQPLLSAMLDLKAAGQPVTADTVLARLDGQGQTTADRTHRAAYLAGEPVVSDGQKLATDIAARSTALNGKLTRWIGYMSMMFNIGAFFGVYAFSLVTQRIGRRPTFAIAFLAAALSTSFVFWQLNDATDIFWMVPIMGFFQLSVFGGYAIYFPELFPTRLRSTGTSFCYNVGRFIAASGPSALGLLTSQVFAASAEPLRWAGISMCVVFLIGLVALPFAPETKDQPLPE